MSFPFNFLQDVTSASHFPVLSVDERRPRAAAAAAAAADVQQKHSLHPQQRSATISSAGYEVINIIGCVIKMCLCCLMSGLDSLLLCFFYQFLHLCSSLCLKVRKKDCFCPTLCSPSHPEAIYFSHTHINTRKKRQFTVHFDPAPCLLTSHCRFILKWR